MSDVQKLPLYAINILAGTQSRAGTNNDTVEEYREALEQGAEFPPVIVFSDGAAGSTWLADGFHRYHAHRLAGLTEIACDIRTGTLGEAVLFSAGANGTHGLPRTNADKRSAVQMVLENSQCEAWSDRQIARHCKVSNNFVGDVRRSICHPMTDAPSASAAELSAAPPQVRLVTRGGTTYEQSVAGIGKTKAPARADGAPAPAAQPVPPADPGPCHVDTGDDIPPIGAAPAERTDSSLLDQVMSELDDGHVPDLEEINRTLERENAQLREQIAALQAQVSSLGSTDQGARILALQAERDEMRSLSAARHSDFLKANEKVVDYERQLKRLRKAAGVETYSELLATLTQAREGA